MELMSKNICECLHLCLAMFIECIRLHNKPYEVFEGNKIQYLEL
jgi:hypothetical protein